jgi:Sulfotransferase domain
MALQIVGAGVGRTGTHSLKVALEQLLGGTCHHMVEMFERPDQVAAFTAAIDGEPTDWTEVYADFSAMVDFPGALFWREAAAAFPDAPVLLSSRDAEGWYTSASNTIFLSLDGGPPELAPWMDAVRRGLRDRFSDDIQNKDAMIAAYEAHNAAVRAEVPADRLIDWTPGDGWEPICAALGVAVPAEPFPVTNTTKEFREMIGAPPLP